MTALSSLASASLSSSRGSRRARRDGGTRVRPCCAFVRRKTRSVCRLGSTWRVLSAASAFSGGGDDGGRSGFAQPSLAAGSFRAPPEVGRSSPDDAAQDTRTSYAHTSELCNSIDEWMDRPTGAMVTSVSPAPALAHGLVMPGDVVVCVADEWRQPTELYVDPMPFDEIMRVLSEEGQRPMTLRLERYVEDDAEPGEFLAAHWG